MTDAEAEAALILPRLQAIADSRVGRDMKGDLVTELADLADAMGKAIDDVVEKMPDGVAFKHWRRDFEIVAKSNFPKGGDDWSIDVVMHPKTEHGRVLIRALGIGQPPTGSYDLTVSGDRTGGLH